MLKELRTQHRTVIQMAFSGYKNNEIAERLEMTPATVSGIVRSPLGKAYLKGLQDKAQESTLDVRKKLVSLNSNALKTIERLLNPAEKAPHSVQFSAAKDVLDRTGYKPESRLSVDMTMQTKTDSEIDAEINAMQESIAKTYSQDPNQPTQVKEITKQDENILNKKFNQKPELDTIVPNIPFIDEQLAGAIIDIATEETDFSDDLVTFPECDQDAPSNVCKSPLKSSINSPDAQSEESVSLIAKIPVDLFQNLS